MLEAYRDSIFPQHGPWRADLWFTLQATVYVLKVGTLTPRQCLTGTAVLLFWLLAVLFGGGITLLVTLFGSALTLVATPILLLLRNRRAFAVKLFAVWACYLGFYVAVSTVMAAYAFYAVPSPFVPYQRELCADAGCFAVERVEKASAGSYTTYTVFWHLASNDRKLKKRFPGRFLEIYMFDQRGQTFRLPENANQNPLDVSIPAGETVRGAMTYGAQIN